MTRSPPELAQATAGILITFTGFVLALQANSEAVAKLLTTLHLPGSVWLAPTLAVVLLLVGASLLWQGLPRKSRLQLGRLLEQGLLIDPDTHPGHLSGRSDDIRRLSGAVVTHPLVFLTGESGSGKSALVRCGLIPALQRHPGATLKQSILPIYLDSYPVDWEDGLRQRLADAVWQWLEDDDEQRKRLSITDRGAVLSQLLPATTASLFRRIREELGLIPLVIFDQFDNYQVANRRKLLRDGRWITAAELTDVNLVWRRIDEDMRRPQPPPAPAVHHPARRLVRRAGGSALGPGGPRGPSPGPRGAVLHQRPAGATRLPRHERTGGDH